MERKTLIKRLKGVMAMMLAFLILTGNPLIAQARDIGMGLNDLTAGLVLNEGDRIYANGTGGIYYVYIDNQEIEKEIGTYYYEDNGVWYFRVPNGMQLELVNIVADPQYPSRHDYCTYYFITPSRSETTTTTTTTTTVAPPHTHSYEWITTLEPTATTDGLCEYRCECGSVTASQPVSYATVLVKNILSDIQNAPENGTVTLNYDGLRCLSKKMVETLLSRPDVTLVVQFTDKDITRQFTIPAGQAPTDGADWYGYYYLGALYGWQ